MSDVLPRRDGAVQADDVPPKPPFSLLDCGLPLHPKVEGLSILSMEVGGFPYRVTLYATGEVVLPAELSRQHHPEAAAEIHAAALPAVWRAWRELDPPLGGRDFAEAGDPGVVALHLTEDCPCNAKADIATVTIKAGRTMFAVTVGRDGSVRFPPSVKRPEVRAVVGMLARSATYNTMAYRWRAIDAAGLAEEAQRRERVRLCGTRG